MQRRRRRHAHVRLRRPSDEYGDFTAFDDQTGAFTWTPWPNVNGIDPVGYRANNGHGDVHATLTITVSPVNDAPSAIAQALTTDEDTPLAITLAGSDVDNDPLTFAVTDEPTHGDLSGTLPDLTYTPDPGYNGPDAFTFTANDGVLTSAPATVDITVGVSPCTKTWDGGGDGSTWDDPANWSGNAARTVLDFVCITNPALTITDDSATASEAAGIAFDGTLVLSGSGDFRVTSDASTIANLQITDESFTADAAVSVGRLTLGGGNLGGTGTLTVHGDGSDAVDFTWSGGDLGDSAGAGDDTGALVLGPATTSTISGSDRFVYGGHDLTNYGSLTDTATGTINAWDAGVTFTNALGATWTVGVGDLFSFHTYSLFGGLFANMGAFNKVGSSSLSLYAPFDNDGTFEIHDLAVVTFRLGSGGPSSGDYAVTAGALEFQGGTFDFTSESLFERSR